MKRLILDILIFLSILILPTYLSILFVLISVFIFNNFLEAILFSFLISIIYGNPTFGIISQYAFVLITLFVFLISPKVKEGLRFYNTAR